MNLVPPNIYIKDTGTAKGLGAFAARKFSREEVVELCPVLVIDAAATKLPQPINTRVFDWAKLAKSKQHSALALGYGSMYNHDNPANMRYEADATKLFLRFIAIRDIEESEELTINYNGLGGVAEWHNNSWFDRMKVQPV